MVTQTVVTKETTISKQEMPSSLLLEVPALAEFNKAWADLTDWLSLLDRVITSQIVTVGDLDEINDMIIKQKVREISRCYFSAQFHVKQKKNVYCTQIPQQSHYVDIFTCVPFYKPFSMHTMIANMHILKKIM